MYLPHSLLLIRISIHFRNDLFGVSFASLGILYKASISQCVQYYLYYCIAWRVTVFKLFFSFLGQSTMCPWFHNSSHIVSLAPGKSTASYCLLRWRSKVLFSFQFIEVPNQLAPRHSGVTGRHHRGETVCRRKKAAKQAKDDHNSFYPLCIVQDSYSR